EVRRRRDLVSQGPAGVAVQLRGELRPAPGAARAGEDERGGDTTRAGPEPQELPGADSRNTDAPDEPAPLRRQIARGDGEAADPDGPAGCRRALAPGRS